MKAAYIEKTGSPDVIQFGTLPKPTIRPDQVLVRVEAVAVNPIDTYIRNGANYWPLPFPFVVGCDLAGIIEEVGDQVRDLKVGQRVWGSNQGLLGRQGTFAEYAAVEAQWLYPVPDGVSSQDAAACALVGITAYLGLALRANLQPGETIFVRGGTGGVGAMVLQMAKAMGARIVTTARDEARAHRCMELGADFVVNHTSQDVKGAVREFAPHGVDVFWETLREPNFDEAVELMAERARMVLMAGRDARPPFPVGPFYVKGCSLHGFVMFKATPSEQQQAAEWINHALVSGQLRAQIDRVLPLSQTALAHRIQEESTVQKSGGLAGKIVLTPDA